MSSVAQIGDRHIAILNDVASGVFEASPEAIEEFFRSLEGERLKYACPPGRRVRKGDVAAKVIIAAMQKSADQQYAEADYNYDDGSGYSRYRRWKHACPITGEVWYCESHTRVSEY